MAPSSLKQPNIGREDGSHAEDQGGEPEDRYTSEPAEREELDPETEAREGLAHSLELLEKHGVWTCPASAELLYECHSFLEPLVQRRDITYSFGVLDTRKPFASSCPNGDIWFSRGLLEGLDDQEILYFAAHEMAHTELRHFATRPARLGRLKERISPALALSVKLRLELAAVLAVRHMEEFEADTWAAEVLGVQAACKALTDLEKICRREAPESLNRPTHPHFPVRVRQLQENVPLEPVEYLFSLLKD